MSVRLFSELEIVDLFRSVMALPQALRNFLEEQHVKEALQSAIITNVAAFSMTYGEKTCTEVVDFALPAGRTLDPSELESDIGLLLYNCVRNGGRDFLPAQDRAILSDLKLAILKDMAEEAERGAR